MTDKAFVDTDGSVAVELEALTAVEAERLEALVQAVPTHVVVTCIERYYNGSIKSVVLRLIRSLATPSDNPPTCGARMSVGTWVCDQPAGHAGPHSTAVGYHRVWWDVD